MEKERILEILNSRFRNLFFASLISARNIEKEDLRKNIEILETCKEITDDPQYAEKINDLDKIKYYIDQGLIILHRDLEKSDTDDVI